MKFDSADKVEEIVFRMRDSENKRSENRAVINRLFNGDPPYDEHTAEENGVEINRNFLSGVQVLADARRQWNTGFLNTPDYFKVITDFGPVHKREAWSSIITSALNKRLKRHRGMMEQARATGAQTMLHGIAPSTWKDRECPYPVPLPIDGVLIPSDTDIDFENLTHYALFRQYTPNQLGEIARASKRDPGWQMDVVNAALKRATEDQTKSLSGYAGLSAERLEESLKQDGGFWESDAVPTIDAWDFYFLEKENGNGVYRRIILDWPTDLETGGGKPTRGYADGKFLYTSGKREYCKSIENNLHCQFGDCSAVAPFKYHSVRSLGWLLWGVCDLQNRLECRVTEAVFENLMWFFRVAGQNDFNRLKMASFHHLGVIPNGIAFVPAQERFVPEPQLIESARGHMKSRIAEMAASYTSDFNKGESGRELTATETMARVNSINALVAGMMTLAYTYEEYKYAEIGRRFSVGSHPAAESFRKECQEKGVPEEALNHERWEYQAERVIGAGNKTIELAAVQFLQGIRKNLGPQSQRKVDHISIRSVTDQPDLADDLAPLEEVEAVSDSTHDAELATNRLMQGLELSIRPDMILEEYVIVWLKDLAIIVQRALATNSGTLELLAGVENVAKHIGQFLQAMATNDEEKDKVRQYSDALGQIMNHVKGIAQRVQEQMQAQGQGQNGEAAKEAVKLQGQQMQAQVKAVNSRTSHAQKTAQKQVQFEMEEARKDRALEAEIGRETARFAVESQARIIEAEAAAENQPPANTE